MDFVNKFKEVFFSVFPIAFIGLFIGLTIVPLGSLLVPFLVSCAFVIIGLGLFLTGAEIGLVPMGEKLGEKVSRKRNLPLLLTLGLVVGFCVTFAEPDVNVLCLQVSSIHPDIDPNGLRFLISGGLALFLALGLFCILKKYALRIVFVFLYLIVFILIPLFGRGMVGISFDASGSTTGPLAVPFILALGLGISKTSKKGDVGGFGLTGIASIGPIAAVLMSKLLLGGGISAATEGISNAHVAASLSETLRSQALGTLMGFAPLVVLLAVLQVTLIRFPRIKLKNVILGIIYSFVGIVFFLTGAEYGFMPVAAKIGSTLFSSRPWLMTSLIAWVLGLFTVVSEPAVWVLTGQVEDVTSGRISKKTVMLFLCFGVSVAVFLAAVRVYFEIGFAYFAYGGIGIALMLSLFSPPLFTSLAFDSGGVASGPMSASFILSFVSAGANTGDAAFGVIGLIAIAPIISIQILGIIYGIKEKRLAASA